ncbi:hypothetical protein Tsubulata_005669 [Turnera subulata]|uniref:Uncharacterized protein n=1 Tax=Turnera subulata TaxID=218843 RepID=A0A9Q0F524_9ROSI|nr:hypothetical protein Tsubulata_005669 [Turnera subulata]
MEEKTRETEKAATVWDCGSPLYDAYEIASLGHTIDRHSVALPFPTRSTSSSIRSNLQREAKILKIKEEGLPREGIVSRIIKYFQRKRTMIKEMKVRDRAPSCRFYCFSTNFICYRKKASNVRRIM